MTPLRTPTTRRKPSPSVPRRLLPCCEAALEKTEEGVNTQQAVWAAGPMLDDAAEDQSLTLIPFRTVDESLAARLAGLRPGPSDQHEILVNISRSELHAAMTLMEHRERWWMEGMSNAESAVGMEMDRVRAGEMLASQEMNYQMTSLVETLRMTQCKVPWRFSSGSASPMTSRHTRTNSLLRVAP